MNLEIKDNSRMKLRSNQLEDGWLFMLFLLKFFVWVKYVSLGPVSAWREAESRACSSRLFWECVVGTGNALGKDVTRGGKIYQDVKFAVTWLFSTPFLTPHNARWRTSGIILAWKGLGWSSSFCTERASLVNMGVPWDFAGWMWRDPAPFRHGWR